VARKNKSDLQKGSSTSGGVSAGVLEELDRVFHEKARLGIMTAMVSSPDGMKTGQGRNTNSLYRITAKGRRAFERYLSALETILNAARRPAADASTATRKNSNDKDGLSPAMG